MQFNVFRCYIKHLHVVGDAVAVFSCLRFCMGSPISDATKLSLFGMASSWMYRNFKNFIQHWRRQKLILLVYGHLIFSLRRSVTFMNYQVIVARKLAQTRHLSTVISLMVILGMYKSIGCLPISLFMQSLVLLKIGQSHWIPYLLMFFQGFLPKSLSKSMYVSFLAGCFRSIRFGLEEAHG